jgi:WD40 repeat protein
MTRSWFLVFVTLWLPTLLPGSNQSPPAAAEKEIARLIQQLGHEDFPVREAATKKLEELGADAWEPLRRVAASTEDAEVRARAVDLVERITQRMFGQARLFAGHEQQVNNLALSGDGKRLLSAGLDATIRLWDVETGKELRKRSELKGSVWGLALSRDGKRAFFNVGMGWGSGDWAPATDFTIQVWDTEQDRIVGTLIGHTGEVKSLAVSPDGQSLISTGRDRTVRVWDVATGKERHCMQGHTDWVRRAVISPDGRRVLSASKDQTVRVWDVETGKEVSRFTGHEDDILGVAATPDGKQAVSVGADRVLRHWDIATGKELRRMEGHTTVLWGIGISPLGRLAISGGGSVRWKEGFYHSAESDFEPRLWDLTTGQEIFRLHGNTSITMSVVFAPDGRHVFTSSSDTSIRMWRTGWPGQKSP